jgi:predicted PurR-regulated permease PerM
MKDLEVDRFRQQAEDGWWSRERALVLALFIATALAFYLCYLLARPFLPALAWALTLAVVAHPLHDWIARRIFHPNLAAVLAVLLVAATVVAPSLFVTQRLVRESMRVVEIIETETASGRWQSIIERNPQLAPILKRIEGQMDLRNAVEGAANLVTQRFSSFVGGSVWFVGELVITFFFLFYFFRDRRLALNALKSIIPLSNAENEQVFERVAETIYATVYGTLAVALVQGFLGGLVFWGLGIATPFLWGVVMALLAVVPMLGAFLVWLPVAGFLALEGSWGKALFLLAWGGIVIALVDNLLYPVLVGKRLRLHTLLVFVAMLGGLVVFGASGIILGPVVLAVTAALIEVWRRRTGCRAVLAVLQETRRGGDRKRSSL